jgi:esterase
MHATQPEGAEFAWLAEAAAEVGVDPASIPPVNRRFIDLPGAGRLSLLAWGAGEPELVLLHGGGQNAHTWDLVLLLLGRPAIAIDLPGHGHSSWRADRDYGPVANAAAVAIAIEQHAPHTAAVIGMSLGGLTLIHLAATRPALVRRALLVDVSPGSREAVEKMTAEQRGAVALTGGPRTFASRQEMVDAAIEASPRRPASAVRRGVIHNSRQLPDGAWAWRYDRSDPGIAYPTADLWDDVGRLSMPTALVTGAESGFVTLDDQSEMKQRLPSLRIESVDGAGHAVQSDQPKALAALIAKFVPPTRPGWNRRPS